MNDKNFIIVSTIAMICFISTLILFIDKKRFNLLISTIINVVFGILLCIGNIWFYTNKDYNYFQQYYFLTLFLPNVIPLLIINKGGVISCIAVVINAYLATYAMYTLHSLIETYIFINKEWTQHLPLILYPAIWVYMKFSYVDFQNSIDENSPKFSLIFLLFAGVVFAELLIYNYLATNLGTTVLKTELFSAALLSVYFFSFIIFKVLFNFYTKSLLDISNNEIFNKDALHIEERLELSDENNQKLKILKHDLKHILVTVSQLISSNKLEDAKNYIQDYTNKIDTVEIQTFSKNPIIDSVLTYYSSYCKKNNIEFYMSIDDFEDALQIPVVDFSVFISNCLENAVNATKKVQKNKVIKLSIINNKNRLVLQIKNSYNGRVKFDTNNKPITNKKNHGIGSTSIQWFIEKYGLDINYETDNYIFTINVLINTTEK